MLFSEPKIPQFPNSRARITVASISVLFSEPKIPQSSAADCPSADSAIISVLFSEPKIPQCCLPQRSGRAQQEFQCSSASRKFLNRRRRLGRGGDGEFQCSSASRKFLNFDAHLQRRRSRSQFQCSSASRKFLNATSVPRRVVISQFQCSSASRKFLNTPKRSPPSPIRNDFSALQRAENSSIPTLAPASIHISDRDDHASSFLSLPGASP